MLEHLDRETVAEHNFGVTASDGRYTSRANVRVKVEDANDQAPVFTEECYAFDVSEMAITGTTIGRVYAEDFDLGTNGDISYSIQSHWSRDMFSLHPDMGVFTLIGTLDYEQV